MSVEFRVLGGEPVAVPAGRCRALLATLLLRPNQFVSVDELLERLWGNDAAQKTLQMTVVRLRQALGAANCVRTMSGGYLAGVGSGELDLLQLRELARSGNFAAAMKLWWGPALTNWHSPNARWRPHEHVASSSPGELRRRG